jgi:ATP-dependent helicase HrpA
MVLEAERNGCLGEVMVIAAALSIQDPRERPAGKEQAAAEAHARFVDPDSDFLTHLRLWDHLRAAQAERSSSQFRRLCKAEHLNYLRVREWQDIHGQLRQATRSLGLRAGRRAPEPDADAIHRSLLAGLLSHLGMRDGTTREFLGARNARFAIAPGSVLSKRPPAWIMAAELVETNRMWGRIAARVRPEWAEELGAHLVKRSHGEPWWDARRGAAMTKERVTLYGLPIVGERTIPYGRIDPDGARDMFLDHALVAGDWQTHHAFVTDNAGLLEEVRALEHRARRGNLLVDDESLFAFFDRRVGREVTSTRHFDRWWKRERQEHPDLLTFRWADVVHPSADDVRPDAFPETWRQGDLDLALHYVFDPSDELDGVTVDVPLAAVNRVTTSGFDWHVPGLRAELVAALIRSLPKALRRTLGPATEHAAAFLASATPSDGPLLDVLGRELARRSGIPVPAASWSLDQLPPFLRMTYRVVDGRGRAIAWSKDLDGLRAHVQERLRAAVTGAARHVERTGLTSWTIGALPRTIVTELDGHRVTAYPALVNEGETVGVRVFATEAEQRRAMWSGTRRLLLLSVGSPTRDIQRRLTNTTRLGLAQAPYASAAEILVDCITASLDRLLADAGGPAWDAAAFAALHDAIATGLVRTAVETATLAAAILAAATAIERRLDERTSPGRQRALTDIHTQVARLVHPGFVRSTGMQRLPDLCRYLEAADHRLDKLLLDPRRDRSLQERVESVEHAYERALTRHPAARLADIRWSIEELRVSLFAQHLGTTGPVSEARILRAIDELA